MIANGNEQTEQTDEAASETLASRNRLLAALDTLNPLTKDEAEMIMKSIMEARERSIGENYSVAPEFESTPKLSRRERVMALRAKLKPISHEDAEMIRKAIKEAREASIPRDLSD